MPRDIIILHLCAITDDHMINGLYHIKHNRQIFSFWTIVCTFTSLKTWRIKILKKRKKTTGDIIILHKCTKNHDHILYCSWDMACDRCNCYFSFWVLFFVFLPPSPPSSPKNENFYIWYTVPEIWRITNVIIFHFGLFFALLPH